jgi:single-strand DNA-binding protein
MSLVNISLVGNHAKPPEQMYFASGRTKTTLIVAINTPPRNGRNAEVADFYRVETWGKLAELAAKYLQKGNQVGVTGRLVFDHWTDKAGKSRITPIVEAAQLALPPRLKVVPDEQAAEQATQGAPIGGEIVVPDQESDSASEAAPAAETELSDEGTYASPFVAEVSPPKSGKRARYA